jgi:hypothetical protein
VDRRAAWALNSRLERNNLLRRALEVTTDPDARKLFPPVRSVACGTGKICTKYQRRQPLVRWHGQMIAEARPDSLKLPRKV